MTRISCALQHGWQKSEIRSVISPLFLEKSNPLRLPNLKKNTCNKTDPIFLYSIPKFWGVTSPGLKGSRIPPWSLTASFPLKIDGWSYPIPSYWVCIGNFSGVNSLLNLGRVTHKSQAWFLYLEPDLETVQWIWIISTPEVKAISVIISFLNHQVNAFWQYIYKTQMHRQA